MASQPPFQTITKEKINDSFENFGGEGKKFNPISLKDLAETWRKPGGGWMNLDEAQEAWRGLEGDGGGWREVEEAVGCWRMLSASAS